MKIEYTSTGQRFGFDRMLNSLTSRPRARSVYSLGEFLRRGTRARLRRIV
jgi:hypothetical protein